MLLVQTYFLLEISVIPVLYNPSLIKYELGLVANKIL